ncbi:unnamed protein product [Alopecurus aequalis]
MAAIRCTGAGRELLRRAPGILRREQGVLQHVIAPLSSSSSNRYMSSDYKLDEHDKKKLAVDLIKERPTFTEIGGLNETLDLINSAKEKNRYRSPFEKEGVVSDACRQQQAARTALEAMKIDLVSSLLRPEAGKDDEYKKKLEEFADATRRHKDSLVLEGMRKKYKRIIAGLVLWGIPLTIYVGKLATGP